MKVLANIFLYIIIVYFIIFTCAIDSMSYSDIFYHVANMGVFYTVYYIINKAIDK